MTNNLPIFLINLKTDTKRLQVMDEQFKSINAKYTVIDGVDMRNADLENNNDVSLFTKFNIIHKTRCDHKQIDAKGAIGCTFSHYKAWQTIIKNDIDKAMIL